MMDLSEANLAIAAATFLVAGVVKGVTGMGLPTVAMGVLVRSCRRSPPRRCCSFRRSSPMFGNCSGGRILPR